MSKGDAVAEAAKLIGVGKTSVLAAEPSDPPITLPRMAPPEIEWNRLSPRGREILRQVGLRLAAGYPGAAAPPDPSRAFRSCPQARAMHVRPMMVS